MGLDEAISINQKWCEGKNMIQQELYWWTTKKQATGHE